MWVTKNLCGSHNFARLVILEFTHTLEEVRLGTSGGTSSSCSTSRSRCGLRCCCFFQTSEVVEVVIVVVVIVAAAQAGFFCHWCKGGVAWNKVVGIVSSAGWSTSSKSSMSSSRSSSSIGGWRPPLSTIKESNCTMSKSSEKSPWQDNLHCLPQRLKSTFLEKNFERRVSEGDLEWRKIFNKRWRWF